MKSYVYGDAGTDLVVTHRRADGTAFDVTGATSIALLWREVGTERSGSVSGSILGDPADGQFIFEDIGTELEPPAGRGRSVLEFRTSWTQSSEQHYSLEAFRREIVSFP